MIEAMLEKEREPEREVRSPPPPKRQLGGKPWELHLAAGLSIEGYKQSIGTGNGGSFKSRLTLVVLKERKDDSYGKKEHDGWLLKFWVLKRGWFLNIDSGGGCRRFSDF